MKKLQGSMEWVVRWSMSEERRREVEEGVVEFAKDRHSTWMLL